MPSHECFLVVQCSNECRDSLWIADISQGNADIAQETTSLRPLDWTMPETLAKLFFCKREQRDQFRTAAHSGVRAEFVVRAKIKLCWRGICTVCRASSLNTCDGDILCLCS